MKKSQSLAVAGLIVMLLGITAGAAFAETSSASAQVLIIIPERPDLYPEESSNQAPVPTTAGLETAASPTPSFGMVVKTFQPGQSPHVVYTYTDFN